MRHLLDELQTLLQDDTSLVADDKLLKNKVIERALNLDAALLRRLLAHPELRRHFFTTVDDIMVFDKIKFQQFVQNKEFLPDSYTAFKNKIGLTVHDDYITTSKNVVLTWAYKDCVLEGGQTKEDRRRNEIFWNETLAAKQIDRLLHPKAFTGFTKYSANGKSTPVTIQSYDNFIIKGNNLLVLHSLKPVYANRIKLIYIDPPYNTGSDGFLYNDNFNHSTWLTFMKNRLEIAWELLAPDGCIFIQIDDTEFAYLKVLCDELFGRNHFRENIILKSSTESGVNAINVKRGERLFKVKENILFYAKSTSFRFKPFYTKAEYNTNYRYEVIKNEEYYTIRDLKKVFVDQHRQGRPAGAISRFEMYSIEQEFINYALNNPENIYSLEKNIKKAGEKFRQFATANKEKGIVEAYHNSAGEVVLIYDGGALVPLRERIVSENGRNYFGVLAADLWVDIGTTAANEGGISFSNGKKPEKLLRRIIEMTTDEGDIVLDYHLGSGTTAAVAHKLNRRYIGIEQMDYGENDSVVRLQNVINGDTTGISKGANWRGGGSFIYMELKKYNQFFIEKIMQAKTNTELESVLTEMLSAGFINHKVNNFTAVDYQPHLAAFDLAEQKRHLLFLLDMNYLYIPFSEIEDASYPFSDEEIALNKTFYTLQMT